MQVISQCPFARYSRKDAAARAVPYPSTGGRSAANAPRVPAGFAAGPAVAAQFAQQEADRDRVSRHRRNGRNRDRAVVLALVVAAVRREDRTPHLPVEAPGPVTALARRVLGLHVRRTHADVTDLRHGMSARRH